MNIIEIIEKKKRYFTLTKEEINYFIDGVVNNTIEDYQITALLMAINFAGLNLDETTNLTEAMVNSGEILDLSSEISEAHIIDKHSTGGVGDKLTLMFLPIIASLGYKVAKLSGRGLGHTGGTIDKLESIPGFNTSLTNEEFIEKVKNTNIAIASQTKSLTPADGKLYALRDVTSTIDIKPLIASSVVCKKIASGANHIVLDVKYGKGAFLKTKEDAYDLALMMVNIGKNLNKNICAVISNMDIPLGRAIGNSLEVIEAIEFLKGNMETDLKSLTYELVATVLMQTKKYKNKEEIFKLIDKSIENKTALNCFRNLIKNQNGNEKVIDDYELFKKTKNIIKIKSKINGKVLNIDALKIAKLCKILGAGRTKKTDTIDYSVGIYLNKKDNELVKINDTIATVYYNDESKISESEIEQKVYQAYTFGKEEDKVEKELIYKIIN